MQHPIPARLATALLLLAVAGPALGAHAAPAPLRARAAHAALETFPLTNANNVSIVTGATKARNDGHAIRRGLRLAACNSSSATIALHGTYTRLSGTLYPDDAGSASGATFSVSDVSDPTYVRPLYAYRLALNSLGVPFTFSVRNVQAIQITTDGSCNDSYAAFDLVANVSGGDPTPPPFPLPLEQLHLLQSNNVRPVPVGNLATYSHVDLDRGIQLRACNSSAATINLDGRFTRLAGALYADDSGVPSGAAFTINDATDPNYVRPLYAYHFSATDSRTTFSIPVRGVRTIQVASDGSCNDSYAAFDLLAGLDRGGAAPPPFPRPLEELPLLRSTNVQVIPVGNLAVYKHRPLGRGVQLSASHSGTAATIDLSGRFARLRGTLYTDDSGDATGTTFTISEADDSAARVLYRHKVSGASEAVPLSVSLRGVHSITIAADGGANDSYAALDLVVKVSPA